MDSVASNSFIRGAAAAWEDAGPGMRRQVLGYDEGLMLVCVRFEHEAVGTLHHHPHRQVSYVVSGRFAVEIDGQTTELGAGDCFYVPPNAVHGAVALEAGCLIDVFAPARRDFLGPASLAVLPSPSDPPDTR